LTPVDLTKFKVRELSEAATEEMKFRRNWSNNWY